jgi:hypothetical protein
MKTKKNRGEVKGFKIVLLFVSIVVLGGAVLFYLQNKRKEELRQKKHAADLVFFQRMHSRANENLSLPSFLVSVLGLAKPEARALVNCLRGQGKDCHTQDLVIANTAALDRFQGTFTLQSEKCESSQVNCWIKQNVLLSLHCSRPKSCEELKLSIGTESNQPQNFQAAALSTRFSVAAAVLVEEAKKQGAVFSGVTTKTPGKHKTASKKISGQNRPKSSKKLPQPKNHPQKHKKK